MGRDENEKLPLPDGHGGRPFPLQSSTQEYGGLGVFTPCLQLQKNLQPSVPARENGRRQRGEGEKALQAVKEGLDNLLTALCPLQPDICNVLLPALKPPWLVATREWVRRANQIKDRAEKGRKQSRNDASGSLSRMLCDVCL